MEKLKLFSPGPVMVREDVRNTLLHYDICHRSAEFERMFIDTQEKIKQLFNADDTYYSVIVSGSGTSANEAVLSSVPKEGEAVLLIKNGVFGERLEEIIDKYSIPKIVASFEWADYPDIEEIESLIKRNPEIALVAMVFHETSTGMINPVREVGELCVKYNKKYFVDSISAAGGEFIDVVMNNIDFTTSVGGKCVGAFPGAAYICAKESYLRELTFDQCKNVYLNLYKHYQSAVTTSQTPNTPNLTLFWPLNKAISNILEQGLEEYIDEHRRYAAIIREGIKNLGLKMLLNDFMSNTVTSVFLPKGIDVHKFLDNMKNRGYELYIGKGKYEKMGMFQIANMGNISEKDCYELLTQLEICLEKMCIDK